MLDDSANLRNYQSFLGWLEEIQLQRVPDTTRLMNGGNIRHNAQ